MDILYILLIVLFVARAFGEVSHRLGQPALIGELIAGLTLGVVVTAYADSFPFMANLKDDRVFVGLATLGMFFLMLLGGVEMRVSDLAQASAKAFVVASCGLVLPVIAGFWISWVFLPDSNVKLAQCLFVGTALAITAVPVSIRVLMDLGKLDSRAGKMIVSAAIIDDVLSFILLAVLIAIIRTGSIPSFQGLALLIGKVALFFVISYAIGRMVVPAVGRIVRSLQTPEFEFTSLILAALVFAALAELLGLHFILGSFMAGLLFERQIAGAEVYDEVKKRISAITGGFLAPIFFASIGMHMDLSAVTTTPIFVILLIVVAFLTKLIGAGIPAYLLGLSKLDAWAVGIGMSGRGAVELIIADIALRAGLFSQPQPPPPIISNLFSAVVIVALSTTIATPLALGAVFGQTKSH